MIIIFSYFPKTHHDHATLGHSNIINSGLFYTLIKSYIWANICRFIYSTWLSKYCRNILYIYIHQSRSYKHLSTHKYSLLIILLRNSNYQSSVTYISSYTHPIQISIVQSKEQHVRNHLSTFHLNQTVNEPENVILQKLRRLEKCSRPMTRSCRPGKIHQRPSA